MNDASLRNAISLRTHLRLNGTETPSTRCLLLIRAPVSHRGGGASGPYIPLRSAWVSVRILSIVQADTECALGASLYGAQRWSIELQVWADTLKQSWFDSYRILIRIGNTWHIVPPLIRWEFYEKTRVIRGAEVTPCHFYLISFRQLCFPRAGLVSGCALTVFWLCWTCACCCVRPRLKRVRRARSARAHRSPHMAVRRGACWRETRAAAAISARG